MASADASEEQTIATMNKAGEADDVEDIGSIGSDNPEELDIEAGEEDQDQEEEEGEDEEQENEIVSLSLELGDIIRIIAPSHREIHEHTFIIDYLTARKIKIIDTETIAETILNIDATGNLTDESITNIELLSRSDEKGYARQNHLVVSTWIDIKFGGDLPTIITGLITNVEEDMIEIRTYPEDEMIYINFDYTGIPEDLPIEQITIRPPPANFGKDATNVLSTQELENIASGTGDAQPEIGAEEGEEGATGFSVSSRSERERARKQQPVGFGIGENATEQPSGLSPSTLDAPSSAIGAFLVPPSVVRDKLKSILLDADQIKIGDDLDVLVQVVDIPDENRRFNLDKQCDDLLDSLVSNIPASEKTRSALSNIQRMVERFKELRNRFSAFDQNGNPSIPQSKSILYKPLVESLMRMNKSLHWIIPVVKSRKVIYDVPIDQQTASEMDIEPRLIQDEREAEIELQRRWNDGGMSFSQYMTSMSSLHMTPFSKPKYQHDVVVTKQVSDNITAVIDNLDNLYSSIVQNDKINRRRFVIQKYNLGLTKLQPRNTRSSAKLSADFVNMTPNDKLEITGFITFPEPVIYYSRIMLPNTCILDKSNLNLQHAHYWEMLRQTMSISTHEITNLNEPLDMNSHHFLSHIKHFILDPTLDEQEKYRKFLEIIVPKTRQIFDMMRRYIHGRLTLQDVLAYIEPFLVYQEDLNVKQYDEIVAFLFERVLEYKRNYATNYRKFTRLRAYKYHVRYLGVSFLYKLLVTGKMMDADVFKAYGLQDVQVRSGGSAGAPPGEMEGMDQRQRQQMRGRAYATGLTEQTEYNENLLTSSELISRMLAVDYAKLYMDAVAITTTELITPFDFNLVLGEQRAKLQQAGAMTGGATAGTGAGDDESGSGVGSGSSGAAATAGQQPNAGARRFNLVLAKNYPNEESVNEDNDSDMPIYFDKKYDITDYSFIENYRKKQETMTESDFKLFLVDELIKNKKLSMEEATTEASALLTGPGMREVKDGDYAVVEVDEFIEQGSSSGATAGQMFSDDHDLGQTETHFLYFKRDNGKWVRDSTIPSLIPSSDRNYFCNIDRDCIPLAIAASDELMAQQGPGSGVELLSSTEGSAAIKKAFLDKMKGEFDVKYQVTRENFTKFVKRKFEYDLKNITRITEIQNKEFYKYNDKQYQMGFHSRVPKKSAIAGSDDDDDANAAFNDDIEAILSPMEPLKDKILSQTDFVKRQYDILQFVSSFTRKANEIMDEDPHWLYCIKSNAKLMPSFYETIAIAFIQSHGAVSGGGSGGLAAGSSTSLSLNVVIDTICKERGTISDDGEAWVDKYSGSIIKRIEHITEEGFDDAGFRLITRDIIEADAGDDILKVAKPVAPGGGVAAGTAAAVLAKYDSPNAKIINNIITTMTGYMGINLHEEREFIIQNTIGLLETSVPSEDAYKLRSEKVFREKGKHLPPYRETFYQTLLLLTLAYLIVAIQCAIPTPKTRKTHAGCVRSFSGYPIDGEGDVSGMMYVACIAYKIKTSIEPWNTLKSFKKEGDILAKLKTLIDTLIITKAAIKERLQTKRDHNKQHGAAEAIPDELSINRWGGFLPPMKSLDNMPTPQNVASDFVNQMITDMKRGYSGQHEKLHVLETKCLYFSLSIQQMIHSVVKNSSPLLMNMASEPFLENACCNDPVDRRGERTIDYFMAKAQNIHHHNRIIGFLEKTSREMAVLTRPSMIVDNRNTRFHYPEIPADFDEKTIYRAFIAYCRLNHSIAVQAAADLGNPVSVRPNPISAAIASSDIRDICPERPGDWNPKDIIDDKIRKLKQANNLFDKNSLERLLHVVNKQNMIDSQNIISKQRAIEPMPFQRFRDAILHLNRKYETSDAKEIAIRARDDRRGRDNYDEDAEVGEGAGGASAEEALSMLDRCVIPSELRGLLIANMDTRDISIQEDTQEMRDIKNYLQVKNKEMTSMVIDFLHQNAKQTKTKMKEIENIINTILSFEINKSNGVLMSSVDETTTKSIQFMKNSIHRLIDVIPTIIMNGIDFDDTHVPKHWGFSDTHMKDIKGIISSHYSSLKTFYNDNVIKEVLRHVSEHVKDIKLMMENTPFLAEIFFDEDADAKIAAMAAAVSMAAASSIVPKEVEIVVPESESGGRVPHSTRKNIFTTYSIFDREIVRHLYLFYFLSLLQTYIYLVVETPISIYQTEPMRVIRSSSSSSSSSASSAAKRGALKTKPPRKDASLHSSGAIARASNRADDEDSEEDHVEPQSRLYSSDAVNERNTGTINDIDVIMGNKKALGQRVCELLIVYLRILEKDKTAINFNLAAIKEKLTRVKDKEKDGVVERIGAMSVPERKLENLMKNHKMGIWSRGTSQTGIVIYDQDYYDEEREEMDKIAQKERLLGKRDYVTDMNRDIYVLDALEEDRVAEEIERDELDMSGIPEDDDDGEDDTAFIHRHDDEGEGNEGGGAAAGGGYDGDGDGDE